MSSKQDTNPKLVLVFSGKRKSGKDYLTDELLTKLPGKSAVILRLSGPLKKAYADENGLDYEKLLDASEYKEQHRHKMVDWGVQRRKQDPEFFCRLAIKVYEAEKYPIWIVSDARRLTDLDFFKTYYGKQTKFCRVLADDAARQNRGWKFTAGIDDQETECGLDNYKNWDFQLDNDGRRSTDGILEPLLDLIKLSL